MVKTLIKQATIVTMNDKREVLHQADLLVEGDRIRAISAEGLQDKEAQLVDGRGQVLLPGLINAHAHSPMSLFRNYGNDVNLQVWLNDYIWPLEAHLDGQAVYDGARLNIAEMLLTGTTSFIDQYYFTEEIARAVEEMGIRAILARGMTLPDEQGEKLKEVRELFEHWQGKAHGRIHVLMGPHAIYTNSIDYLKKQKALAEELGISYHVHISETRKENEDCQREYGMSPVQLFDKLGMLNERTVAAHCVWLSDEDIAILADRRVNCVYNPASNLKLASGFMPLEKLRKAGINVCLGTDGASSNNSQDMIRDMAIGSLAQKAISGDPEAASARTMLEMATINGARAMGQADQLGSLEVGKKADMILVDFNNVGHTPFPDDVEAALVYSSSGRDVSMTMVDGQILVEGGRLVCQDAEEIRARAQQAWTELKKKGGKE